MVLHVLGETGLDHAEPVIPFTTHSNNNFRRAAFRFLGKAPQKARHIDLFIKGLQDPDPPVVHATLQALAGITDERLLPLFEQIAARYQTDESHVRENLKSCLGGFGYKDIETFQRRYGAASS